MRIVLIDKRGKKSWIDKSLIVGFVLGLIGTLVIPWIIQMATTHPDFVVTLDQPAGRAEILESIKITVNVSDNYDMYHKFHNYKHSIALVAYEVGGRTMTDINITDKFIEQRFKMDGKREVSQELLLTPNENAKIGHRLIKISGIGGDGRERSCLFDLEVK